METNTPEETVLKIHDDAFARDLHQQDLGTLQQMQDELRAAYNNYVTKQEDGIAQAISDNKKEVRIANAQLRNVGAKYSAASSRINTIIVQLKEEIGQNPPPLFSGDQSEWSNWISDFKIYIQENRHLSEEQKLARLREALQSNTDRGQLNDDFYESVQLLIKSHEGVK